MQIALSEAQVQSMKVVHYLVNHANEKVYVTQDELLQAKSVINYILTLAATQPFFCLVMNRPIDKIDFSTMKCNPTQCRHCKMAVHED